MNSENGSKELKNLPKKEFDKVYDFEIDHIIVDICEPTFESGNISNFETFVLLYLLNFQKPLKVLEIGTFNGRTTINIANVAKMCLGSLNRSLEIVTVDLPIEEINNTKFELEQKQNYEDIDELGFVGKEEKIFDKYPYHREQIKQVWCDSAKFHEHTNNKYVTYFDYIFVDASHSYDNCISDSINATTAAKSDAIILWHDYGNAEDNIGWPGVKLALNELHYKYNWPIYHIENTSVAYMFMREYLKCQ